MLILISRPGKSQIEFCVTLSTHLHPNANLNPKATIYELSLWRLRKDAAVAAAPPQGGNGAREYFDIMITIIFSLGSYSTQKWLCQDIISSFSVFSTTKPVSQLDLAAAELP